MKLKLSKKFTLTDGTVDEVQTAEVVKNKKISQELQVPAFENYKLLSEK